MFHHDRMMGMSGMGFVGIAILVLMLALIVLAVIAIVKIIRDSKNTSATDKQAQAKSPNDAIAILDKRFAQGEISEDEYYRMKAVLKEE